MTEDIYMKNMRLSRLSVPDGYTVIFATSASVYSSHFVDFAVLLFLFSLSMTIFAATLFEHEPEYWSPSILSVPIVSTATMMFDQ